MAHPTIQRSAAKVAADAAVITAEARVLQHQAATHAPVDKHKDGGSGSRASTGAVEAAAAGADFATQKVGLGSSKVAARPSLAINNPEDSPEQQDLMQLMESMVAMIARLQARVARTEQRLRKKSRSVDTSPTAPLLKQTSTVQSACEAESGAGALPATDTTPLRREPIADPTARAPETSASILFRPAFAERAWPSLSGNANWREVHEVVQLGDRTSKLLNWPETDVAAKVIAECLHGDLLRACMSLPGQGVVPWSELRAFLLEHFGVRLHGATYWLRQFWQLKQSSAETLEDYMKRYGSLYRSLCATGVTYSERDCGLDVVLGLRDNSLATALCRNPCINTMKALCDALLDELHRLDHAPQPEPFGVRLHDADVRPNSAHYWLHQVEHLKQSPAETLMEYMTRYCSLYRSLWETGYACSERDRVLAVVLGFRDNSLATALCRNPGIDTMAALLDAIHREQQRLDRALLLEQSTGRLHDNVRPNSADYWLHQFENLKQSPAETLMEYMTRCRSVYGSLCATGYACSERDCVLAVVLGFRDNSLATALCRNPGVDTMAALLDAVHRERKRRSHVPRRSTGAVATSVSACTSAGPATAAPGLSQPPTPCRHCGGPHWNRECPTRSKARNGARRPAGPCFRCNRQDHYARDCPQTSRGFSDKGKHAGGARAEDSQLQDASTGTDDQQYRRKHKKRKSAKQRKHKHGRSRHRDSSSSSSSYDSDAEVSSSSDSDDGAEVGERASKLQLSGRRRRNRGW